MAKIPLNMEHQRYVQNKARYGKSGVFKRNFYHWACDESLSKIISGACLQQGFLFVLFAKAILSVFSLTLQNRIETLSRF